MADELDTVKIIPTKVRDEGDLNSGSVEIERIRQF